MAKVWLCDTELLMEFVHTIGSEQVATEQQVRNLTTLLTKSVVFTWHRYLFDFDSLNITKC